jgi:hypothetical protein
MIGRTAYFTAEAVHHYLNLFAVIVGATSKGRKGTSWGHIIRLARSVDEEWVKQRVKSGLSSGEGLIWAVRDEIMKGDEVVDEGVSDKRLLVEESEFASTLKVSTRETNTLSPLIRLSWDTGDLCSMTKNSPAVATGAHISILGHITSHEVTRCLCATDAANGFANRFLWVCAKRSKALPEGGEQVNLSEYTERLRKALESARTVREIRRDDQARALWYEVYEPLSEGKPGLLGAVTSRAEAQVMRLACIYALLDLSSIIRVEHLKAALALWRYCEDSARFIFGDSLGDPVADEILRALRQAPEGYTRTEIRDLLGRHAAKREIDRALGVLSQQGLACCKVEETGGRSAERWFSSSKIATKATYATEGSVLAGSAGAFVAYVAFVAGSNTKNSVADDHEGWEVV